VSLGEDLMIRARCLVQTGSRDNRELRRGFVCLSRQERTE
jgi:hypothetical protein